MGMIVGRGQSKLRCDSVGCQVESDYVNGEFDGQRAVEPAMQKRGWQCLGNGKTYCPDHAYGGTLKPNAAADGRRETTP